MSDIIQKLANALVTEEGCLGRKKVERNVDAVKMFRAAAENENLTIPSDDELRAMGKFNGEGSC